MLLQTLEIRSLVVLVDGIDEASDLRTETEAYFVRTLAAAGVRLLLTSRPEGVHDLLYTEGWVVMRLKELSEGQQRRCLQLQLEGSEDAFYDHLARLAHVRRGNDRLFQLVCGGKADELAAFPSTNKLLLAPPTGGEAKGGRYDPELRQCDVLSAQAERMC
jgi:hypothetical protein